MDDRQNKAPLAGERAKGVVPSSDENQAARASQTTTPKATRYSRFVDRNQVPIHVSGKAARTLLALVVAGTDGVTAQGCGPWAYRLAAYVHVLRRKHGLEIRMDRIQAGRSWHGRYVLMSPVAITPGRL